MLTACCLLGVFGKIKSSGKLQEPKEAVLKGLGSSVSATIILAFVQSVS